MTYKEIIVKTHYTLEYLKEKGKNVIDRISSIDSVADTEIVFLYKNCPNDFKIVIWPLNQFDENKIVQNVTLKITEVLDNEFITSIYLN